MPQNMHGAHIAAVLPAAGLSSRMGTAKPLMPFLGKPLIFHGIEALAAAGAGPIIVVTGHEAAALSEALRACPVRCVHNPMYATTDMLASIRIGLRALSGYDAVFILPCDLAPLQVGTAIRLIDAFAKTGAPIVHPSYRGRGGHPPLLSREAAEAACRYRGGGGLRAALRPFATRALLVETDDPGVLSDLDTPSDARRAAFLDSQKQRKEGLPMRPISQPITRKDHLEKTAGRALYTADLPPQGVLIARVVRARKANTEILSVVCPPLPDGYYAADGRDLPRNEAAVHANELDMPVFADGRTGFVGEAVAIIAGPDRHIVEQLARETVITYGDEAPPVLTADEAVEFHPDYGLHKGDARSMFAQADFIHEETFRTGRQEQAYIETQALEAYDDDGVLTVRGSMQCPYYIVSALTHAFSRDERHVRIVQEPTGGAFGGKEEYPSLLACQLAAVAVKSGKRCRLVMDRREDIGVTTKRHPSRIVLRAAVKDGRVTALDADIVLDGGAYRGLSEVVLQRSLFCITGVYNIEHLSARARVARTHTVPNGAFRGFGAPQSFFAIESMMNHIAERLCEDPAVFKRAHLVRQGDRTATSGVYHERVPLPEMLDRALAMSGYAEKRARFAAQSGRYARGIGVSLVFHGCGFTGNGERDIIRARVRLEKSADGAVTLLAANTEMGQGLRTTFPKIVASALDIPVSRVSYGLPDTLTAPNSGPTVASRSIMIVGRLFERAAMRLKEAWRDGEAQAIEEEYIDPPHRLPFDAETFTGDAYPAFSWAVNVAEVEIDTRTGQPRVTGVWAVFDCGTPIDLNVLRGQAEGGIVQGLGYGGYEHMVVTPVGAVAQSSLTDYIIPTAADVPPIEVVFYDDPYHEGPSGARGAGELTLVAAAPAYAAAVENAAGARAATLPLRAEAILALMEEVRHA